MKSRLSKKHYLYVAGSCMLLILALVSFCLFAPLSQRSETCHLYIDTDDTADSVVAKLTPFCHRPALAGFSAMARHGGYNTSAIIPGRYAISPDDAVVTVFRRLRQGRQSPLRLTIPSTRTMPRLAAILSRHLMADSVALATAFADSTLLAGLGCTTTTLPALIIPNTYEFYWTITPQQFLARMKREHDNYWTSSRRALASSIGLTPAEVATLASIVDEETANAKEKPLIAGMYINRLHAGMPLQADPTVKYAVGDFSLRRIYRKHLLTPSPYNTYLNTQLPPGPIRIASTEGLNAVLNATQHNYLYMCANADFSGTHVFAHTYEEHLANAAKYTAALNKRGIK